VPLAAVREDDERVRIRGLVACDGVDVVGDIGADIDVIGETRILLEAGS
jgi:hypothetical protein